MSRHRKRPAIPSPSQQVPVVSGMGWYPNEAEFLLARDRFPDGDELHDSYANFVATAEEAIRKLARDGIMVERIPIRVDEVLRWAERNGRIPNAEARSEYILLQVQLRGAISPPDKN